MTDCKACTKCKETKPLAEFNKDRKAKDGLFYWCRPCSRANAKKWADNPEHKARRAEKLLRWKRENRERHLRQNAESNARRRKSPHGIVHRRVALALRRCIRGAKEAPTFTLLGYSADELKRHLERQFTKGMSWVNAGQWHIDHITPLSSFNITSARDPDFLRAWALPNLRPLWAADNIRKSNKIEALL